MNNVDPFKEDQKRSKLLFFFLFIIFAAFIGYSYRGQVREYLETSFTSEFPDGPFKGLSTDFDFENLGESLINQFVVYEDYDGDDVVNIVEWLQGSDIELVDTDADGFDDYEEFFNGYDPNSIQNQKITPEMVEANYQVLLESQPNIDESVLRYFFAEKAKALVNEERFEDALVALELAHGYEADPSTHEDIAYDLFDFLVFDSALLFTEQMLELYPDYAETYFLHGYSLQKSSLTETGKEYYLIGAEKGSTNPYLFNNLGVLSSQEGDKEAAINYYQQAIDLDDSVSLFHKNIASTYRDLGAIDQAQFHENKASELTLEE